MSEQKIMNRWLVVVGALLIQLCLGAIYAWGAFTGALQTEPVDTLLVASPQMIGLQEGKLEEYESVRQEVKAEYDALKTQLKIVAKERDTEKIKETKRKIKTFRETRLTKEWIASTFDAKKFNKQVFKFSAEDTSWIFSAGLASFAFVMVMAGRLQDKYGPKKIALIGGLVLGAGYVIAGFTGTSFPLMLIFVGIVGGAGIGLGYVCPIAACVKWFPDLKGLITGLAVAGFGAGAFIFVKLAGAWMNLIANYGVNTTFLIFGIIFAVFVTAGALLLSNPPAGFKPKGWNPPVAKDGSAIAEVANLTQGQAVRTVQFWMIWLSFVFSAGCGLMVIKCLKNFGQLEGGLTAAAAGSALGLLALFNGLGRVVWGSLSHKLTAKYSVVLMCVLQAVMMFVLLQMGNSTAKLAIAACWLGFNFGGNFALFPLLTLENFGPKNLGANYGAIFSAYGVGGIVGPVMAGKVWDSMGTFNTAFIVAGVACVIAAGLALTLKHIEPTEAAS